MFVTLLLGIAAGWGALLLEDHLRGHLARVLSIEASSFQPGEMRALSLVLCLLAAALVASAVAVPHAVPLAFGAALSVMFPRLRDRLKAARRPDYDE